MHIAFLGIDLDITVPAIIAILGFISKNHIKRKKKRKTPADQA